MSTPLSSGPQGPPDPSPAPGPEPGGHPPGQVPYGGVPGFAPYGLYGPSGPRPPAALNAMAVAALVLGLLCLLPGAGLLLGLIALRQIRRRGEKGRGMAVAGVVLSSAGLVLWAVALVTGAASAVWAEARKAWHAERMTDLRPGDCFNSPGGLREWTDEPAKVPCAQVHDGEVFAVLSQPRGPYPGDDRLTAVAEKKCASLQYTYVGGSWDLPDHVAPYHGVPSREGWRLGDRRIVCVFGHRDARSGLIGSLREGGTMPGGQPVTAREALGVAVSPSGSGGEPARRAEGGEARVWRAR
ncbi:hypothetical protein GCM10009535_32510 [Streptomyces thermocarboxydovorans]|uniref:DUF4190 domain-containing protein n=1 Tax=Streptomyces thermocarboxydovorans TaxID=59298 RepID=A0ABN1HI96_9ACTN